MPRTLLTGATGTLGTALRARLDDAGHNLRAASRSPPKETDSDIEWVELDLTDDTEFRSVLDDVDIVVHAATAPRGDTETVDVDGTKRLLDAAERADVDHFLYPSIVGVDRIPFSYYEQKTRAETIIRDSGVPTTIVRATQFHSFVADLLDTVAKLPVWPLPTELRVQPVDARDVAAVVADHATVTPSGHADPVGGPEVHSVRDLAEAYRDARGMRRPIVRIPLPGATAAAFRAGHATCPGHAQGTTTWTAWLGTRYASSADERDSPEPSEQSVR